MARAVFLVGSTAITLGLAACLALGIATVQRQPWWFWRLETKHVLAPGLALVVAAGAVAIALARARPATARRRAYVLLGAIALGYGLQHGLALAERRGAAALRARIQYAGHREFALTATRGLRAGHVLRDYEAMTQGREHVFARSKPPGQLLFYMAAARVAAAVMPHVWDPPKPPELRRSTWQLMNLAVLAFPLCACLVLAPLASLARDAAAAPVLYVCVPSVALVGLHMDQVLYPLLATCAWALAALGSRNRGAADWALGAAAGAAVWLGLFVSFSLLPVVPLVLVFAVAAAAADDGLVRAARRAAPALAAAAGAFALLALAARLAADYDMIAAFERVAANHRAGKRWDEAHRLPAMLCTLSEFLYWLGPALAILLVWEAAAGAVRLARGDARSIVAPGLFATILATALLGTTYAEVARLWIFFVPAVVLVAARRLAALATGPRIARFVLPAVIAQQLLWTLALKNWQDFR